ncbi:MAG: hypothetical protein Q4G64_07670, partial [bacterium]|nr:hypothetical protein [bacterium]
EPEPAGPTTFEELVVALQEVPGVISAEHRNAAVHVRTDGVNEETLQAVAAIFASTQAGWTEAGPSVLTRYVPEVEGDVGAFLLHLAGYETAPTPEGITQFAGIASSHHGVDLVYGPTATLEVWVSLEKGTDWHPVFLEAFEQVRAAAPAMGVDPAASGIKVDFGTERQVPHLAPLVIGDAASDPAWETILEQLEDTVIVIKDNDLGRCDIEEGPTVDCSVMDPTLAQSPAAVRSAVTNFAATVTGAGYAFTIDGSLPTF